MHAMQRAYEDNPGNEPGKRVDSFLRDTNLQPSQII